MTRTAQSLRPNPILLANYEPDKLGRYYYWADHNPHWMSEIHTRFPQKLNVWAWAEIIGDRILESVFLDGNLDGATYLTLLQEDLMPALAVYALNEEILLQNLLIYNLIYKQLQKKHLPIQRFMQTVIF
jgi:hypothetical protein